MCIVIYKPAGKILPKSTLKNSWQSNKDGAGFAYADGERVHIVKGFMHFKRFWKEYVKHQEQAMLIHFRIATCGSVCPANTHPFRMNDQCAMAHNGMLSIRPPSGVDITDSETFMRYVIMPMTGTDPEVAKEVLNHFSFKYLVEGTASGSKLVFLHADGSATLYNERLGDWVDEVWYSNSSWKTARKHYGKSTTYGSSYTHGGGWDDDYGYGRRSSYTYSAPEYDYSGRSWDNWQPGPDGTTAGYFDGKTGKYWETRTERTEESKKKEAEGSATDKQTKRSTDIILASANAKSGSVESYPIVESEAYKDSYAKAKELKESTLLAACAWMFLTYGIQTTMSFARQLHQHEAFLKAGYIPNYLFAGFLCPLDFDELADMRAQFDRVQELGITGKIHNEMKLTQLDFPDYTPGVLVSVTDTVCDDDAEPDSAYAVIGNVLTREGITIIDDKKEVYGEQDELAEEPAPLGI